MLTCERKYGKSIELSLTGEVKQDTNQIWLELRDELTSPEPSRLISKKPYSNGLVTLQLEDHTLGDTSILVIARQMEHFTWASSAMSARLNPRELGVYPDYQGKRVIKAFLSFTPIDSIQRS